MIALRLDTPILDYYRATGRGWQGRMRADLARIVARRRTPPKRKTARKGAR
jgi:uncharacterized protein (DUF4415 family)